MKTILILLIATTVAAAVALMIDRRYTESYEPKPKKKSPRNPRRKKIRPPAMFVH